MGSALHARPTPPRRGSSTESDSREKSAEKNGGDGGEREQPVRGIGTGFFVRSDGLIATNGHVVEGATEITVQIGEDERPVRGTLLGRDDATDLAFIKIDGGPFPILSLGDSDGLEVGEWVTAIGNPF